MLSSCRGLVATFCWAVRIQNTSIITESSAGPCCCRYNAQAKLALLPGRGEMVGCAPAAVVPQSQRTPFLLPHSVQKQRHQENSSYTRGPLTTLFYTRASSGFTIILCHPLRSRANVSPFRKTTREEISDVCTGLPVKSGLSTLSWIQTVVSIVVNHRTRGESLEKQMLDLLIAVKHPPQKNLVNMKKLD